MSSEGGPIARLLADMLTAADRIARYTAVGRERFDQDELVRGWIEYQLILFGEAARRAGESDRAFHAAHPEVPWGALIGMRNILIHQYHRVDPEIVWTTATEALPAVRVALARILRPPRGEASDSR